jgi:hypothetical protein
MKGEEYPSSHSATAARSNVWLLKLFPWTISLCSKRQGYDKTNPRGLKLLPALGFLLHCVRCEDASPAQRLDLYIGIHDTVFIKVVFKDTFELVIAGARVLA